VGNRKKSPFGVLQIVQVLQQAETVGKLLRWPLAAIGSATAPSENAPVPIGKRRLAGNTKLIRPTPGQ
jgi:hypothetical protein